METTTFLNLLLALGQDLWNSSGQVRSIQVPLDSYNYIIVGGGATGAVVAARLSQDSSKKVLLLEKGGASNRASDIPKIYNSFNTEDTQLTHNYRTVSQENICRSDANGQCTLPVGRLLGGGSAVNAMAFVRGNKLDFDGWAANGLPTWSYDKVLPFFKKFENSVNYKSPYRGSNGPINVSTDQWSAINDLTTRWKSAGMETFGIGSGDYNGQNQKYFSKIQRHAYAGIRASSDNAYLQPLDQKRENLHVLTFAHVTKVLFQGTKATGVEYVSVREYDNNTRYTVNVTEEIIVSAGTFESPKILALSGIGPRAQLEKLGIKVIADRPGVGQNLIDPVYLTLTFDNNLTCPADFGITEVNYRQWLTKGTGRLRSTGAFGIAFLPTKSSANEDDIRAEYISGWIITSCNESTQITLAYYNLYPCSVGSVKVNSADPLADVLIDPKYLTCEADMLDAVDAVYRLLKLSKAKAFQEIGLSPIAPNITGCDATPWSDSYVKCYVKTYGTTSIHFTGTSKMGNSSDKMAVVDDQLRVYGVQNLRVADGSIFPTPPRAHPTAACWMVGEVVSSLISGGKA
ncbi:Glucose dehydrogenase -like protein [Halotydeus destructor]|nr:Glucose dehydrogenase -like protein [Halotydeus destructor]